MAHSPVPLQHGLAQHSTFWPCVLNLSKAIIGAGTMAIPRAFYELGWVAGSASLALVALLTYWTLSLLVNNTYRTGATTYVGLTRQLCGPGLALLLQAALLLFCFGFSVVYLVVMRDLLLGTPPQCNGLLCEFLGIAPGGWVNSATVLLGVAGLLVAPFAGFRDMGRLSFMNGVGLMAVLLLVGVAVLLGGVALARGMAAPLPTWPQWGTFGDTPAQQWGHLVEVVPVLLACYVGHQNLHPLIPLLVPATPSTTNAVVALALTVAAATFGSISLGTALAFGPDLQVNVLNNLFSDSLRPLLGPTWAGVATAVVRGGYLVSLLGSTLLYVYPLRTCLAQLLCSCYDMAGPALASSSSGGGGGGGGHLSPAGTPAAAAAADEEGLQQPLLTPSSRDAPSATTHGHTAGTTDAAAFEARYFYLLTYSLLTAAAAVAILVPNIWVALSAIGDIATTVEAFIVPGVIAMVVAWAAAKGSSRGRTAASLGDGEAAASMAKPQDWYSYGEGAAGGAVALLGVLLLLNGLLQRS